MYKAIRQLEFDPENFPGEIMDEVSETIPGQALSIKEVLIKFSQGTLGSIGLPVHYDIEGQVDINDDVFNSYNPTLSPDFDLSEAEAYLRTIREQQALKKEINTPKASDERTPQISDDTTETE